MPKKQPVVETEAQRQYREAVEKIAGNIAALAKGVSALLDGPLNKKALIILLANSSGQSQKSTEAVIGALQSLEKDWLNK